MHRKISVVVVDSTIRHTVSLAVGVWLTIQSPGGLSAAPTSTGTLAVASDPAGAVVYVDGQFVGRTPVRVRELAPGDVKVTVSDGRASASNLTTVTVRALTGTWRSTSVSYRFMGVAQGAMQWATTLTQVGASLSGTVQAVGAIPQLSSPGTITGSVGSSSPITTLVASVPGWLTPTFTLEPGLDVNTLTGRWTDSGSSQPITFTRQ